MSILLSYQEYVSCFAGVSKILQAVKGSRACDVLRTVVNRSVEKIQVDRTLLVHLVLYRLNRSFVPSIVFYFL